MKNRNDILKFILIFILVFLLNYFVNLATMDEIWTYGFSRNVADGLIPYNDFNMILLPFHSLFIGTIMKIFSTSFLFYHTLMAFFYSVFLFIISKRITIKKTLFLIIYLVLFESYFYNPFISFLVIMILIFETSEYKYKDLIIGLLIGYIMMTKVNIGAFLFLVFFFKSKNKLRSFLYSAIIPLFVLFYLIYHKALINCFDYCVLGLKNFANNGFKDPIYLVISILIIGFIIYKIIKTKDKNYYYILAFQIICYPLVEFNHVVVAIYPLFFYLLSTLKKKYNVYLVLYIMFILTLPTFVSFRFRYTTYNNSFIGYRNYYDNDKNYLYRVDKYINDNPDTKMFYLNSNAYFVRLNHNQRIEKYDLINRGNMGSDEDKLIYELDLKCLQEDCRIIAFFDEYGLLGNQMPINFKNYVLDNYELCYDDFVYCRKINYCPKEKE